MSKLINRAIECKPETTFAYGICFIGPRHDGKPGCGFATFGEAPFLKRHLTRVEWEDEIIEETATHFGAIDDFEIIEEEIMTIKRTIIPWQKAASKHYFEMEMNAQADLEDDNKVAGLIRKIVRKEIENFF